MFGVHDVTCIIVSQRSQFVPFRLLGWDFPGLYSHAGARSTSF